LTTKDVVNFFIQIVGVNVSRSYEDEIRTSIFFQTAQINRFYVHVIQNSP